MVEFPFPLLTLLQPKSYPVPSISARIFTIPKLQNIHCWHFMSLSALSSLFIKDLPNCNYVRPLPFSRHVQRNWSFRDHLSRALPTERIINLLRLIRSESVMGDNPTVQSLFDMLKVIIKFLEVSFRECNRQLDSLRLTIWFGLGIWFWATERLVQSLPG